MNLFAHAGEQISAASGSNGQLLDWHIAIPVITLAFGSLLLVILGLLTKPEDNKEI